MPMARAGSTRAEGISSSVARGMRPVVVIHIMVVRSHRHIMVCTGITVAVVCVVVVAGLPHHCHGHSGQCPVAGRLQWSESS